MERVRVNFKQFIEISIDNKLVSRKEIESWRDFRDLVETIFPHLKEDKNFYLWFEATNDEFGNDADKLYELMKINHYLDEEVI
jgi:hypothetical protein